MSLLEKMSKWTASLSGFYIWEETVQDFTNFKGLFRLMCIEVI